MSIGEIYALKDSNGKTFIRLLRLSRSKDEFDLVQVFYTYLDNSKANPNYKKLKKSGFFIVQYPLKMALKGKEASKIGKYEIEPDFDLPIVFRSKGLDGNWVIFNSENKKFTKIGFLSDEHKKINPNGVWSGKVILQALREGWNLKNWE